MNKTYMLGYYQGVVEAAPAVLSAAKTAELSAAASIQHLRHADIDSRTIRDFLIDDVKLDAHLAASLLSLNADQLESRQAALFRLAYDLQQ